MDSSWAAPLNEPYLIRYAMWRWNHTPDLCVIAHERVGGHPVISVQFNPQKPKGSTPKPAPLPTATRELELEVA